MSTGYLSDSKLISYECLMERQYPDLQKAIIKVVPNLIDKMDEIRNFIFEVPELYQDIVVMSQERKQFYSIGLKERLEKILLPVYQKIHSNL